MLLSTHTLPAASQRRSIVARPSLRALQATRPNAVHDPYSTLGLDDGADEKTVKQAFRKLALRCHPDVAREDGAEVKFLKLTEAYEFIMSKLKGGEPADHFSSPKQDSWDFHDWFWNFRIKRNWARQAQKARGDVSTDDEACSGQQGPAFEPGFTQPESKQQVNSQLAGLRKRAAARAIRPSSSESEDGYEASTNQPPQATQSSPDQAMHGHVASQPSDQSMFNGAASSLSMDIPDFHYAKDPPPLIDPPPEHRKHQPSNRAPQREDSLDDASYFNNLWGGQGQEHDAFRKSPSAGAWACDSGHVGGESHQAEHDSFTASNAVEFWAAAEAPSDCPADDLSDDKDFDWKQPTAPKFIANQERKEAVMHQLTGMRRKARFARQQA